MSRLTLFQGLLLNLEGKIDPARREYLPKEKALVLLRHHTGKDFGDDVAAWKAWIREHKLVDPRAGRS
jgi:hypothetical protein